MSRMQTFCPHCGRVVPKGQRCPCRPRPKRKPTKGDGTRAEREPWRREYSSGEYQAARQEAIARTKGRCSDCGRVCAWFDGKRWRTAGMGGEPHRAPVPRRLERAGELGAQVQELPRAQGREAEAQDPLTPREIPNRFPYPARHTHFSADTKLGERGARTIALRSCNAKSHAGYSLLSHDERRLFCDQCPS